MFEGRTNRYNNNFGFIRISVKDWSYVLVDTKDLSYLPQINNEYYRNDFTSES